MGITDTIRTLLKTGSLTSPDIPNPHNRQPPTPTIEQFNQLQEEVNRLQVIESTIKPYQKRYKEDGGVLRVDLPISVPEIYNMVRLSSILRTVHLNIKNEIFRRGLRWKKRFAVKCTKCGKEYATEPKESFECECGSKHYRYPDEKSLANLEKFVVKANKNDETLMDVFKEGEYDMEIVDDMFLILVKEYVIVDNVVVGSRIKEIIRGDPEFMRIVGNEKSERGGKWWTCHDVETEILTKNGWKFFKDVTLEDEVATLKDGKYLEYQKPTAKIEQPYKGKMLHFVSQLKDMMVTPDHMMYVRKDGREEWELKPAKDMLGSKNFHYMKRNVEWVGKEEEYFSLPMVEYDTYSGSNQYKNLNNKRIFVEKKIKMDDWIEFFGYYISEGNCSGSGVRITQIKYPEKIEECLKKLPFDYLKMNGIGFHIHSKQLSEYLCKFGHSHEKYIPKEFLNLSKRQLKILYDAMVLGDGGRVKHKNGSETSCITTTSKQLSDDIHEIIFKIGEDPSLKKGKYRVNVGKFDKPLWEERVRYDISTIHRPAFIQGSKVKEVEYDDMVYCVEVPNHIIYTRRNGKSIWGGNCIRHRNMVVPGDNVTDIHEQELGRHYEHPGKCPICGMKLEEVHYVAVGGSRSMDPEQYYIDGEVIHTSKYSPSRTYGYPPVLSVWKEASTLLNMQHYINEYFKYMRAPRGILTANTTNTECYAEGTEILTEDGWKDFKDLKMEDKVASLVGEKTLEFVKPERILSYDVKGKMIQFKNNNIDLLVTPNHEMYLRKGRKGNFKSIVAEECFNSKSVFYMKKDAEWVGEYVDKFTLPPVDCFQNNYSSKNSIPKEISMDLWVEFLGYFLSEGSTCKIERNSSYCVEIYQNKTYNPVKWQNIHDCIVKIYPNMCSTDMGFYIYNKQLYEYLKQFGKSKDKFIPKEIKKLHKRQLRILFDALMLGDGEYINTGNRTHSRYTTISKKLMDDIEEIALKCGMWSNTTDYSKSPVLTKTGNRVYGLSISGVKGNLRTPELVNSQKKEIDYEGKVYCCTVPSGLIYVRRNGKALFCRNSAYKNWDRILENIKRDPHYIPMLATQDNGTGKRQNQFNWINFSNTLQEMEYGNVRDELRIRVSAMYGVSNVMMGDTKGGGGIGNEGLQIVVSDRAVQWGQEVWNQNVFPELCRQFDIFDYTLELRPNIELVEQKKNELMLQKLQVAEGMHRMGFNVELDSEGEFKYSGKSVSLREMQQMSAKQTGNTNGDISGVTPRNKVISEDHVSGLSTGQKLTGKTPRGSKDVQYV